ncbi:hypothetical protein NIES4102_10630 [Chondrocystis sp. NIES-4102]|nr:hypothetical protein NIES4102_10630 [Chondrocystis sp. NIES-4102]
MKRLNLSKLLIAILVVFMVISCQSQAVVKNSLKILLPLYSYPNWYDAKNYIWSDVARAAKQVPIVAIINPNNGPDGQPPNQDYQRGLKDLRESGVTILGYVYTKYGDRSLPEVEQDIALYDRAYNINGIFIDETATDLGKINYYRHIYQFIKNKTNLQQVIINPGTHTPESFLIPTADVSVIFEDYSDKWQQYQPQPYISKYKQDHFASLIHSVPDAATMKSHLKMALKRNIGYIYITDDSPNSKDGDPWNSLPSYWQSEVDYLQSLIHSSKE